tara:strand:- start:12 stop:746 length:735 start_codon:yes stop_codon:yes gene_type:complete
MNIKQQGFSLSELLISLLLSSLITIAIVNHYISCKKQAVETQKRVDTHFDVQMVIDLMRDSIRHAGFTPCLNLNHLETTTKDKKINPLTAIKINPEKTSLTINRMSELFDCVVEQFSTTDLFTREQIIRPKQKVLIADCYHAEINEISRIKHQGQGLLIQLKKPLKHSYQSPAYIGEWVQERFFIPGDDYKKALFYQVKGVDELTDAIHSMSIEQKQKNNKTLIAVKLELQYGRQIQFETLVRS